MSDAPKPSKPAKTAAKQATHASKNAVKAATLANQAGLQSRDLRLAVGTALITIGFQELYTAGRIAWKKRQLRKDVE